MEAQKVEIKDKCVSEHKCSNMRLCIEKALKLHSEGNYASAKMSFLSDIKKNTCTRSIKISSFKMLALLGSDETDFDFFKNFMEELTVECTCST